MFTKINAKTIFVLLILLLAMAGIGGCVLGPVIAEQATPTPPPSYSLRVEPLAAAIGDTVTVRGEGWTPAGSVLITLSAPGQSPAAQSIRRAYASADINEAGIFSTTLTLPTDELWRDSNTVVITAWDPQSSQELSTDLWLLQRQDGSTETPTVIVASPTPVTPTPTNTLIPTATPFTTATPVKSATPGPTATATATRDPWTAYVTTNALNLRMGPGTAYAINTAMRYGTLLSVIGQNSTGDWLKVQVASGSAYGEVGWVARAFTDYRTNAPVVATPPPPATATPTLTSTVVATDGWSAQYFSNRNLAGSPALVRTDAAIDFNWGMGSPAAGLPVDDFSVRWARTLRSEAGTYRFHAVLDDGMRIYLDNILLFNEWRDGSRREIVFEGNLVAGDYAITVEYYERTGAALARFGWEKTTGFADWKGEYWSNSRQEGNPAITRNDGGIDFTWGTGSPAVGLPSDGFSARWTRTLSFAEGRHRFSITVDDGARVWVDGALVVDAWQDGPQRTVSGEISLGAGNHAVRVDYYERTGGASIKFWSERIAATPTAAATVTALATATATTPPTATTSPTPIALPSFVPTASPTRTPTVTVTSTATADGGQPTATPTATATNELTITATVTDQPTVTLTATATPTTTATDEPTATATVTQEATATPTATATDGSTAPPTVTSTATTVVDTEPASSATPLPVETETPTPTATMPSRGTLTGALCGPGESVPALMLYFRNTVSGAVTTQASVAGQTFYEIELPAGTYTAYAWLPDNSAGAAYSQAVACGLGESCTDHTLRPVTVTADGVTDAVDVCDWDATIPAARKQKR